MRGATDKIIPVKSTIFCSKLLGNHVPKFSVATALQAKKHASSQCNFSHQQSPVVLCSGFQKKNAIKSSTSDVPSDSTSKDQVQDQEPSNSRALLRGFKKTIEVADDLETLTRKGKKSHSDTKEELLAQDSEWSRHKKQMEEFISDYIHAENKNQSLMAENDQPKNQQSRIEGDDDKWQLPEPVDLGKTGDDSEGWGFNYTDLFPEMPTFLPPSDYGTEKPTSYKEPLDEERMNLAVEYEVDDFSEVMELSAYDWERNVFGSRFPVIICCHSRFDAKFESSQQMVEEVGKAASLLSKYDDFPVKFATLDVLCQPFITQALEDPPICTLVFMSQQKKVFQVKGPVEAEEIMQLAAHLFFGANKNAVVNKFM